jgi:MraZ protein
VGDCGVIMGRFHGRFDYSIDAKGRVNVPAKFRKALSPEALETFIICRAPDGCLRAYPNDLWEAYESELASRPETPDTLRHKRLLYSTISDSVLDAQGRITLTPAQMKLATIAKDVSLVGQANYIEIWDTERYNAYLGSADDFDSVFFQSVETGIAKK